MERTLYRCDAYWPRSTPTSTVDYNDRLDIVYALFQDPNVTPNEDQINFIFTHGSQCSKDVFGFHVELLNRKLGSRLGKCITIDIATHGDSAVLNQTKIGAYCAWDDVARDVGRVVHDCIDNRGLIGYRVFVGHSMGGMCGMVLSAFEGSLFDCIVPLDPIYKGSLKIGPALESQVGLVDWTSRGIDEFKSWQDYEDYYRNRFCKTWDKRVVDHFVREAAFKLPDGRVRTKANIANQTSAYLSSLPLFGTRDSLLKFISVPTLVLHGAKLDRLSLNGLDKLAQVVQNGQAKAIPAGHNFPFELPEETVDIFIPFVLEHCTAKRWHRNPKTPEEARQWQYDELKSGMDRRREAIKNSYFATRMPSKLA